MLGTLYKGSLFLMKKAVAKKLKEELKLKTAKGDVCHNYQGYHRRETGLNRWGEVYDTFPVIWIDPGGKEPRIMAMDQEIRIIYCHLKQREPIKMTYEVLSSILLEKVPPSGILRDSLYWTRKNYQAIIDFFLQYFPMATKGKENPEDFFYYFL